LPAGEGLAVTESSVVITARGVLLDRLPLKISAVLFAFVLWLAVGVDEPGERTVAVRLALQSDGAVSLVGRPPVVSATVVGRRRELLKLAGAGLVLRRTIAAHTVDSVRIVLRPADVELPAGLEGDVRVRDVRPASVTLRFARAGAAATSASAQSMRAPAAPAAATVAARGKARLSADSDDAIGAADAAFADTVWPHMDPPSPRNPAPPP